MSDKGSINDQNTGQSCAVCGQNAFCTCYMAITVKEMNRDYKTMTLSTRKKEESEPKEDESESKEAEKRGAGTEVKIETNKAEKSDQTKSAENLRKGGSQNEEKVTEQWQEYEYIWKQNSVPGHADVIKVLADKTNQRTVSFYIKEKGCVQGAENCPIALLYTDDKKPYVIDNGIIKKNNKIDIQLKGFNYKRNLEEEGIFLKKTRDFTSAITTSWNSITSILGGKFADTIKKETYQLYLSECAGKSLSDKSFAYKNVDEQTTVEATIVNETGSQLHAVKLEVYPDIRYKTWTALTINVAESIKASSIILKDLTLSDDVQTMIKHGEDERNNQKPSQELPKIPSNKERKLEGKAVYQARLDERKNIANKNVQQEKEQQSREESQDKSIEQQIALESWFKDPPFEFDVKAKGVAFAFGYDAYEGEELLDTFSFDTKTAKQEIVRHVKEFAGQDLITIIQVLRMLYAPIHMLDSNTVPRVKKNTNSRQPFKFKFNDSRLLMHTESIPVKNPSEKEGGQDEFGYLHNVRFGVDPLLDGELTIDFLMLLAGCLPLGASIVMTYVLEQLNQLEAEFKKEEKAKGESVSKTFNQEFKPNFYFQIKAELSLRFTLGLDVLGTRLDATSDNRFSYDFNSVKSKLEAKFQSAIRFEMVLSNMMLKVVGTAYAEAAVHLDWLQKDQSLVFYHDGIKTKAEFNVRIQSTPFFSQATWIRLKYSAALSEGFFTADEYMAITEKEISELREAEPDVYSKAYNAEAYYNVDPLPISQSPYVLSLSKEERLKRERQRQDEEETGRIVFIGFTPMYIPPKLPDTIII